MNKRQNKGIILLGFFILFAISGYAKDYAWQELLDEAKLHNPELIKARQSLEKYNLLHKKSYSGFLPSLSASASASQSGSDGSDNSKSYSYGLRCSSMYKDNDVKLDKLSIFLPEV